MRTTFFLSLLAGFLLIGTTQIVAQHQHNEQPKKPAPLSPPDSTFATLGEHKLAVRYSSPRVRGRIIWGGLVGLNTIWVTGAHRATTFSTPIPVLIGSTTVPAGTYALFTIPKKNSWTVILNRNADQHLADDYNETLDVLRMETANIDYEYSKEELTFLLKADSSNRGSLTFQWEKRGFEIPIIIASKP